MEANESPFIKVPLSVDRFALFFGGWLCDGGDAPEMVIAVVSGENAKVENRRTRLMREEARRYLRHEGK